MSKKLIDKFLKLFFILIALVSCSFPSKKLTLNTKKDLKKIVKIINDKFGNKTKILLLELTTQNPQHPYFEQAIYQNKKDYIIYSYPYENVVREKPHLNNKNLKEVYINEFDIDKFINLKEKAINYIISISNNNFSDFKVGEIRYVVVGKNEYKYYFELIATKQNDKISYIGKKVDKYKNLYRFSFFYNTKKDKLVMVEIK